MSRAGEKTVGGASFTIPSAIFLYCFCSMSMIYVNKFILSTFDFSYAGILLILQAAIAVVFLRMLEAMKIITIEEFNLATAKKWFPVTFMFGLMIFTGSKTIAFLSIPIITVFKNMTNLLIAYGDWYFFHQPVSGGVLGSFGLMLLGSILSGYTDLQFDLEGYLWMTANCVSQASYVLYMRQAKKETKLSEWGMSYYNNILSVPVLFACSLTSNEWATFSEYPNWSSPLFLGAIAFSGLIGTILSFSVFWVVSVTSPTSYSMIGSINKIPITLISMFLFKTILSVKSALSLTIGLISGIIYTYAKYLEQERESSGLPLTRKV